MLILTLSPDRIVVGGGVGCGQHHLLARIRAITQSVLASYLPNTTALDLEQRIVAPALGSDAGVVGTLALAHAVVGARANGSVLAAARHPGHPAIETR